MYYGTISQLLYIPELLGQLLLSHMHNTYMIDSIFHVTNRGVVLVLNYGHQDW
jgi:hypothetical protein